jgi:hypothetical protein
VQRATASNFDLTRLSRIFVCPSAPWSESLVKSTYANITSYGMSDNWAEWYCPDDCYNGTGAAHSFVEAVAPANTVIFVETVGANNAYPGFSLALTPIDGGNSGNTYYGNCKKNGQGKFSLAREFTLVSWRHSEQKPYWCATPPNAGVMTTVAYSDGHVKVKSIGQLSDFKEWAIKQGAGDVGCRNNVDGERGCWYP